MILLTIKDNNKIVHHELESRKFSFKKYGAPNFKLYEFLGKNKKADVCILDIRILRLAQAWRKKRKRGYSPSSGFRPPIYNLSKLVGGHKKSRHQYGDAIDVPLLSATRTEVLQFVKENNIHRFYINRKKGFVHFDYKPGYMHREIPM